MICSTDRTHVNYRLGLREGWDRKKEYSNKHNSKKFKLRKQCSRSQILRMQFRRK
jgi:hypothetical protein